MKEENRIVYVLKAVKGLGPRGQNYVEGIFSTKEIAIEMEV